MEYAREDHGLVRSALTEMVLAAEEEPGNKIIEAEVKRLRGVVRESGRLSLDAESNNLEWRIRGDYMIEEVRKSVED